MAKGTTQAPRILGPLPRGQILELVGHALAAAAVGLGAAPMQEARGWALHPLLKV